MPLMTCWQGMPLARRVHRVVIEELLRGEEASFICMVDGNNVLTSGHFAGP